MTMKVMTSLLLSLALASGSQVAMAQAWHGGDHGPQHDNHGPDRDDHGRGHDDRRDDHGRGHAYGHDKRHHWERGHRYTGPVYVVRDYGRYRLRPPPRGYHWVRDNDNDLLLVAITTGIILDIASH